MARVAAGNKYSMKHHSNTTAHHDDSHAHHKSLWDSIKHIFSGHHGHEHHHEAARPDDGSYAHTMHRQMHDDMHHHAGSRR
jgi:hypothetical protein